MDRYTIVFNRGGCVGLEEYEGGNTLKIARQKAAEFRQAEGYVSACTPIRICLLSKNDRYRTVEFA